MIRVSHADQSHRLTQSSTINGSAMRASLLSLLILVAPACSPSSLVSRDKDLPMSMPTSTTQEQSHVVDQEALLSSLLNLLGETSTMQDVTSSQLSGLLHSTGRSREKGQTVFSGRIDQKWLFSLSLRNEGAANARINFDIISSSGESGIAEPAICTLDFNAFKSRLEAAGYEHQTLYGEHGRPVNEVFRRQQMVVTTDLVGMPRASDSPARLCVIALSVE